MRESRDHIKSIETFHAPAERLSTERIAKQKENLEAFEYLKTIFNKLPINAAIINRERQIIAANDSFLRTLSISEESEILGLRPGEAFCCKYSELSPGKCGTSEYCVCCGAVNAILESQNLKETVSRECLMYIEQEGVTRSMELQITVSPLAPKDQEEFFLLVVEDISDKKRRYALERIFFHDVLNTSGALLNFLRFLIEEKETAGTDAPLLELSKIAQRLYEEIVEHRDLISAENNDLSVNIEALHSDMIIEEAIQQAKVMDQAALVQFIIEDKEEIAFESDKVLVLRILINLLKNALEASRWGEAIKLGCKKEKAHVKFWVQNPCVMSKEVQLQIFKRSFSTKGNGRGLGTYSVKLLGEKYLKGSVSFESRPETGTVFYLRLPIIFPMPAH
ncbi:MAG: GHKL domain-containing protein [SAR324 cluster bacterium]|uniref:histidine kinase n=1 Tax=SAR324 cluster bacterium TaxID=2024889 RepID=A0A7X9FT98_9DELT|nr:GHKL domain-containing protein [SAR324 cluster bacterium]